MRSSVLTVAVMVLLGLSCAAAGQTKRTTPVDAKTYENQQRARRLLALEDDIRTLPDIPVRNQLRHDLLTFIYSNDVRTEFPAADPILMTLLDDLAANEARSDAGSYLRNDIALLLRKHDPETAKRVEAKYKFEVDTSRDDSDTIRKKPGDRKAIIDRSIERLRSGRGSSSLIGIYDAVVSVDLVGAGEILAALLDHVEKRSDREAARGLYYLLNSSLDRHPPASLPAGFMVRYYRCLVASARDDLAAKNQYVTDELVGLQLVMPEMKETDDALYADARSVIDRYRTTLAPDELARFDAEGRISGADDKVAAAMAAAESAATPASRDYLWYRAAQQAAIQKQYRLATDLIMRSGPELGNVQNGWNRDEYLRLISMWSSRNLDSVAANYAIGHITGEVVRARAMLEFASFYPGSDVAKQQQQTTLANGISLLEMNTPDADSICAAVNSRSLLAVKGSGLDDFAARVIRIVNRVPTPGADAKAGTPDRNDFVLRSVTRAMPCVASLFRPAASTGPVPDAALVDKITVKEWRLAATLQAETQRKYPLPR